jgi:hypothetical protein
MGIDELHSAEAAKFVASAAALQHVIDPVEVEALASKAGLKDGLAMARLLIAHLQGGKAEETIPLGAGVVERRRELALICREVVNHAPTTERTLRTLAQALKLSAPNHPLAAMADSQTLWVRAAFDATWDKNRLKAFAPLADGFPQAFDGLLLSTENPVGAWALCTVVERRGDCVALELEDAGLIVDNFNIAPPCILVAAVSSRQLEPWANLAAKVRRGLRRLAND